MLLMIPIAATLLSLLTSAAVNGPSEMEALQVLQRTVAVLGGIEAIKNITAFSYDARTIYRSQTLTQSYGLKRSDQSVSAAGAQIMSFRARNGMLQERIDRVYSYNDYWIWAWPTLAPVINYSVVVEDGPDGFACFNRGQNSFYANDHTVALGYADPYLTDYLVHQAHQFALPWLIKQFLAAPSLAMHDIRDPLTDVTLPGIEHPTLGLTLVVKNDLPYMVRSYEQHKIFGNSTSDVLFSTYSTFGDVLLPRRFQTVYNTFNMVEDFFVDILRINPPWPADYFEPESSKTSRASPQQSLDYPRSEVHEFFETALWGGPFGFDALNVTVEYPIPAIPAIKSVWVGYADYVQLLVEFDEYFLITDASPFRSKILIKWVAQNSAKKIAYVVPSHHHRDHAGGVADYVAAGATLVVPEIAQDYYSNVNGGEIKFATYTEENPFILSDGKLQFRAFWHPESPHAVDWSYGVATAACPKDDTGVVVFNADVVDPGDFNNQGPVYPTSNAVRWDAGYARQWVFAAAQDRVPRSALIVGAHGSTYVQNVSNVMTLEKVVDITGVLYPDIGASTWADRRRCG
ncbi:MAG: hypothetical protein Q9191_002511 [Dirinaria sp. TL-2023a]